MIGCVLSPMNRDFTRRSRRLLRLGFGLLGMVLLAALASAAEPQYGFEHWTVEDGLPQDIIRGIAQTPDGYIWITTLDGLVRFDGVRFTIFEKNNTPGLNTNRFRMMYPGRGGDLWLVNEIGGMTRYHNGVFSDYGAARGIPGYGVSGVTVSATGEVWILAANNILQWNEAQETFLVVTPAHADVMYSQLGWDLTGFWAQDGATVHCLVRGQYKDYAVPPWLAHDAIWGAAIDPGWRALGRDLRRTASENQPGRQQ